MWSINAQQCIKNLKTFSPNSSKNKLSLPSFLPRHSHPQEIADVEYRLEKGEAKIKRGIEWSDPARAEEFDSFVANSKEVITNSLFKKSELKMGQFKRIQEFHGKRINRKRLKAQEGLRLTKEDALKEIAAKRRKEKALKKKRAENNFMKFGQMKRDELHIKKVAARKEEKARLKRVKELMKTFALILHELMTPIHNPEVEGKATNPTGIAEEAKKAAKKNKGIIATSTVMINDEDKDEDITINVGENQPWLQKDFVAFDEDDDTGARPSD